MTLLNDKFHKVMKVSGRQNWQDTSEDETNTARLITDTLGRSPG
jgi:hypothetical protein